MSKIISGQLKNNQKVLWLVPGGSAMKVTVKVARRLSKKHLENLTVTLTDEKYGPVGHPDSNWLQLKEAGFYLPGATLLPVLDGSDLATTVARYNNVITDAFELGDFRIGLFGAGADGHIAGIKPRSPAIDSEEMVSGYEWDDYTRITITPEAMLKLDEAVVYMIGQDKHPIIKQLAEQDLPVEQQPAQILKKIKKATIYNDYYDSQSSS